MSLLPAEQLLIKELDLNNTLILCPESESMVREYGRSHTIITQWRHLANLNSASSSVLYGLSTDEQRLVDLKAAGSMSRIVIAWPKSKALAQYLYQYASFLAERLSWKVELFFYGGNKSGVKSLAKSLPQEANPQKVASGKHSQIFYCDLAAVADDFQQKAWSQFTYQQQTLWALPGVFSQGRLDAGTALLLKYLPKAKSGQRAFDFGCGCGIITNELARNGWQTTAIDTDWLATTSTKRSLMENDLAAEVIDADRLLPDMGRYHLIVSNPPFHEGVRTHYEATERFLRDASRHLKQGGRLMIVANSFLQYEPILAEHFKQVELITQANGFKILMAQ